MHKGIVVFLLVAFYSSVMWCYKWP